MNEALNLPLILLAAFVATASPGPATLAIAGTSMGAGRRHGLALASGVLTGSLTWSVAAALGLSALMYANGWIVEAVRYVGAGYLLFLAFKSAKSVLKPAEHKARAVTNGSLRIAYAKGLALHLTNPKAILFFGSLYAIGVPAGSSFSDLWIVVAAIGVQSFVIFHGYAFLFSNPVMMRGYLRLKRWFEAVFAVAFGAAGLRIFTARLE